MRKQSPLDPSAGNSARETERTRAGLSSKYIPGVALCTAGQLVVSACRHSAKVHLNHALAVVKARAREQTERQGAPMASAYKNRDRGKRSTNKMEVVNMCMEVSKVKTKVKQN